MDRILNILEDEPKVSDHPDKYKPLPSDKKVMKKGDGKESPATKAYVMKDKKMSAVDATEYIRNAKEKDLPSFDDVKSFMMKNKSKLNLK